MNVGFIGVGRMGGALLKAVGESSSVDSVIAFDVNSSRMVTSGAETAEDPADLASKSDIIFLCVKPDNIAAVLDEIRDAAGGKLVVSIAAGVTTSAIEGRLPGVRVLRVMPNTPAVVGLMAAGYSLGASAKDEDGMLVEELLESAGILIKVDEELMDAVTGLSGGGPAYVYHIIDALAKAGEKQGLSRAESLKLSAQTVKGAAEMILAEEGSPEDLIDNVCSPGGTTIEGMKVLEESNLEKIIGDAVKAAAEKSRKLSG